MDGGIGLGVPRGRVGQPVAAHRVAVVAGEELDGRRVLHVLEREGFRVSSVDPSAPADVEVDVVVVVGEAAHTFEGGRFPGSDAPIVLVRSRIDRMSVEQALAEGATGVVREADVDDRLAATVRAAAVGQLCIPSEHPDAVTRPILSPREKQVMSMVVLGFTNLEVANKLHVTETTVKSHLSSAYRKLGVRSRHEATSVILSTKELRAGILTLAGDPAAH